MRISAEHATPGYDIYRRMIERGNMIRVRLDGIYQTMVLSADDETNEIVRYKTDLRGTVLVDPANPDTLLRETVTGKVEFEITAVPPAAAVGDPSHNPTSTA